MASSGGAGGAGGVEWTGDGNWTDRVDDLVDAGDVDGAIAMLEIVVSRLETTGRPPSSSSHSTTDDLRLAAALEDLAGLHASTGHSLKSDELRSRSLLVRARADCSRSSPTLPHPKQLNESPPVVRSLEPLEKKKEDEDGLLASQQDDDEDDWEAIADRSPPQVAVSKAPEEEPVQFRRTSTNSNSPKRRGRGSFLYKRDSLYSDQYSDDGGNVCSSGAKEGSDQHSIEVDETVTKTWKFGTRHVLVLYDFPPKMTTTDLEKLFHKGSPEVAIRWIHDTCALAVFQTPIAASEAQKTMTFPFKVRGILENDNLLNQVSPKDLEPPYARPKTSTSTARRLIAQGMGLNPSAFSSSELRKQEEARKNHIHARQILKEDAWGSDDP